MLDCTRLGKCYGTECTTLGNRIMTDAMFNIVVHLGISVPKPGWEILVFDACSKRT